MIKNSICRICICGALLLPVAVARSQSLTFNTPAGYAGQGNADGLAGNARFNSPCGLAADAAGNLYVADTVNHTIRKVSANGVTTTLAGLAGVSGTSDGTSSNARFNQPQAIAVDANGVVYVADTANHTIRKIAAGVVSTLAGTPGTNGCADGTGVAAQFNQPQGLAVGTGGVLYVADTWNHTIRKVTAAGAVTTLAGAVGQPGSADGTNLVARFNRPQGVTAASNGDLYVADCFNHVVRKLVLTGTNWVTTTLAGLPAVWGGVDGTNTIARFFSPQGVAVDGAGNVYVSESGNNTIRKITAGVVTTLAGAFGSEGSTDGLGGGAQFRGPCALAFSGTRLFVADTGNGTIRAVAASGSVTTLAGSPSIGTTDGAGGNARFYRPAGAAADSAGNVYVSDSENSTIRKVTRTGAVTTFAGLAGVSGSVDGAGSAARFSAPQGVAVDIAGNVYVADMGNQTIRLITSNGVVSTFAGLAGVSGSRDGPGSSARFYSPQGIAADTSGNVYVADTWNHTIRVISPAGSVSTLAGSPGSSGTADGTKGSARFYEPQAVAVDATGTVYVADSANHTIRKITAGGIVTTLAGSPGNYGSLNATGANALFYGPAGVVADGAGNVYVADFFNQSLRKVTAGGVVTTVAGLTGICGSGDGTGTSAQFYAPAAIAAGVAGAFYVADMGNNTLRLGMLSTNGAPVIITQPQSEAVEQAAPVTFSVTASGTALTYQWRLNTTAIPGATASSYTRAGVQSGDVGSYSVVVSNLLGSVTSVDAVLVINGVPIITRQPQDQVASLGQSAVFSVAATGALPLHYQWRFDGNNISGATDPAFALTSVRGADSGSYSVMVTNGLGTAISSDAFLFIAVLPQAWGDFSWGQTNVPLSAGNAIAIAAGSWHNLALQADGVVVGWGDDLFGQCDAPAGLSDALAIAAGGYHSLAIRANGTVLAWGNNDYNQTNVPADLNHVVGIAAGIWHSLALKADGSVVAWGDDSFGQSSVPSGLTNVVGIAAGGHHSLALQSNGQVVGWGENTDVEGFYSGQSTPPWGLTNVVALAAGEYHSLAVLGNGQVVAWGDDSQGQCDVPSSASNVVAVAGGGMHTLALRADGSLLAWGADWNGQCSPAAALSDVVGIGAGEVHSVALVAGTEPDVRLLNFGWQAGQFSGLVQTLNRRSYALEFKASLAETNWTSLITNTGNGALRLLSDPKATGTQGFYRVREW